MNRRLARLAAPVLAAALALTAAAPARAWDPRETHLGMLDRALVESALHLRWMAASELQRGLFTPLRVDPQRLTPAERRMLSAALQRGGIEALGGPGACPGLGAPPQTQRYCVDGDLWELPAVQWLQLGVLAELIPSARAVHHFVDRDDPLRPEFRDPQAHPTLVRLRQVRHNGAPSASLAARTGFSGQGPSVVAWLRDVEDPLAPPRMWQHLELASTLPDPLARAHHLALALVGLGALLHVAQDLAVPAHARGDVTGFFSQLSREPGDRGLPFAELARLAFGRTGLPGKRTAEQIAAARGVPVADSLAEHLFGGAAPSTAPGALALPPGIGYEGLAPFTARRFLSEASVPAPRHVDEALSPEDAAAALLQGSGLDPAEVQGARLSPWPADRGYLQSAAGRPLAAFDTDDEGRLRPYVDEAVYREQFAHLAPRAIEVTRSLLDWVWPAWPELAHDAPAGNLDLVVPAGLQDAVILVLRQDADGGRTIARKVALRPGERNRLAGLPTTLGDGERTVVVLRARRPTGEPLLLEHILGAESKTYPVVPAPYVPPPPPAPEDMSEEEAAVEPAPVEAAPAEPPATETSPDGQPAAQPPAGPKGQPGTTTGNSAAPSQPPATSPKGQPAATTGKTAQPATSPKGQAAPKTGKPTQPPAATSPGGQTSATSPKGQPAPNGTTPPSATSPKDPPSGTKPTPPTSPKGQPNGATPPTSPKGQPNGTTPPTSPKGQANGTTPPTSPKGQPAPNGTTAPAQPGASSPKK